MLSYSWDFARFARSGSGSDPGGGGAPAGAPRLLYTNTNSGPVSGGENNKGCYLWIYGHNFGNFSDYGTTNFVTIGGVAVDNYRYLADAVGPVGTVLGIKVLCVQVGALTGLSNGTAYAISVTVGGVNPSNATSGGKYLDADGNAITFMPNPGPIVFVSLTGSNAAAGTIAAPLRTLQSYNGSSLFTGAIYGPVSGGTTGNQVVPGTHVYLRGGDYGADTSFGSRWCDFFRRTGIAPTGASNTGPIVISSYPGAAGANSPEVVQWIGTSGTQGGFNGADTVRSGESTPWGTTGYSKWIHISNLKIVSHPGSASDAAPINQQTAADNNWVVNNELSWASNTGSPTAAGIAGEGTDIRRYGNYIHDINDVSGNQQNHGIYIGTNTGATGAAQAEYHGICAYNYIENIAGGSGIQARGYVSVADSAPYLSVHHNYIRNVDKHGVNFFDQRARGYVYCNVIVDCGGTGFFCNSDNVTVTGGIYVGFNTFYSWGKKAGTAYPGLYYNGGSNTGTVRVESNALMQKSGAAAPAFDVFYTSTNGLGTTFNKNIWYDPNGLGSKPGGDTLGSLTNPLFTNVATLDFVPQAGSPLLDAGITPASETLAAWDIFGNARPQGSATKWAIGAVEKV